MVKFVYLAAGKIKETQRLSDIWGFNCLYVKEPLQMKHNNIMTGVWFSVLNIIEGSLFPILMLKGDWDTTKTLVRYQ